MPAACPQPETLPAIAPAGQGPGSRRRAPHSPACASRCRSLWEPPSPELPERKDDGGVRGGRPPMPAPGSPATPAPQRGSRRRRRRTRKERRSRTPSAVHLCAAIGCLVRPQSRGCGGAAAGSHLAPHLPQRLIPARPTLSDLPPPPAQPSSLRCLRPFWKQVHTLSLWESLRRALAATAAPPLPPRLFSTTLKLRGAGVEPGEGASSAGLNLGRSSHGPQGEGPVLCALGNHEEMREEKEKESGGAYSPFRTPPPITHAPRHSDTYHKVHTHGAVPPSRVAPFSSAEPGHKRASVFQGNKEGPSGVCGNERRRKFGGDSRGLPGAGSSPAWTSPCSGGSQERSVQADQSLGKQPLHPASFLEGLRSSDGR